MKILCIGDVTSPKGVDHLRHNLWRVRKEKGIDFCIVNCENASVITGASADDAETLFASGADCLTGGNHTLRNKSVYTYLDDTEAMLRPINFGDAAPGHGYAIVDCNGYKILVINAMGNIYIEPTLDNPYPYIDRVLERENGKYDFALKHPDADDYVEALELQYSEDEKEREEAKQEIRDEIINVAMMAASKIVEREISKADNEKLVNDFLDSE